MKGIPGLDMILSLPSFRRMEMTAQPGGKLQPTVDCFTRPGSVTLVNEDPKQLEADYQTLHELAEEASLVFLSFFYPNLLCFICVTLLSYTYVGFV